MSEESLIPPECLETARLVLRLAEPSMARALSDYHTRNYAFFKPFSPSKDDGEAAWLERATRQHDASLAGEAMHWVLFLRESPERVIGAINLTAVRRGVVHAALLGYSLDRELGGRGLMTEGVSAVIRDAFERANLHRIEAGYMPTNERSGRVLRRLGFTVEGYARDLLLIDGEWKDHILTSLTNPNWRREG